MLLLRDLAAGEPAAFERLCDLFDQRTKDGADMSHYDGLLQKALASIERHLPEARGGLPLASRACGTADIRSRQFPMATTLTSSLGWSSCSPNSPMSTRLAKLSPAALASMDISATPRSCHRPLSRPRLQFSPAPSNSPLYAGQDFLHLVRSPMPAGEFNESKPLFSDWKSVDLLFQLTDEELSGHTRASSKTSA